jgi:hypothetical protein
MQLSSVVGQLALPLLEVQGLKRWRLRQHQEGWPALVLHPVLHLLWNWG